MGGLGNYTNSRTNAQTHKKTEFVQKTALHKLEFVRGAQVPLNKQKAQKHKRTNMLGWECFPIRRHCGNSFLHFVSAHDIHLVGISNCNFHSPISHPWLPKRTGRLDGGLKVKHFCQIIQLAHLVQILSPMEFPWSLMYIWLRVQPFQILKVGRSQTIEVDFRVSYGLQVKLFT